MNTLILGHLSESNNHPEIVRLMAQQALRGRALFTKLYDYRAEEHTGKSSFTEESLKLR